MRILYHAINGIGLGHLMRLSAIAEAVCEADPAVHQMMATTANYAAHLQRLRFPVTILPRDDSGSLVTPDRRMRSVSGRFGARLLNHVIDEYDPRVVVFDTHAPAHLVDKIVEEGRQAILVYRRCREEELVRHLREGSLAAFVRVLVPHSEQDFHSGMRPTTLAQLRKLETIRYVGGVVFPAPIGGAAESDVSRRYGLSAGDELIVVTVGGGGLGRLNHKLFGLVCQAATEARKRRPTLRVVCVGGPYCSPFAVPEGCLYVQDEPCLQALMGVAELVIAIPGYNTVQEILRSGVRAILVPMMRKMEDLEGRVESLVARGRVCRVALEARPVEYLRAIEALLDSPRPIPEPCLGGQRAAEEILVAARAPRHYICTREPLARSLATSFRSPRGVARSLKREKEPEVVVRIDWDRLQTLFAALDPAGRAALKSLEVVLGHCDVDESARRVSVVHEFLQTHAYSGALLFCVDDPSGGSLLAQLTRRVRHLHFDALVARFAQEVVQSRAEEVFAHLEQCRDVQPRFKIDITLLDKNFVFVDQP